MKISKIDKLGRIVIPITFRKQLGIKENDELSITREGRSIIISPANGTCRLCGLMINAPQKIQLCNECIKRVKDL